MNTIEAHEGVRKPAMTRSQKTSRFFASELPWFLIFAWFLWAFALGPALMTTRYSMAIALDIRNDTAEAISVVTVSPRTHQLTETKVTPGDTRSVIIMEGGSNEIWEWPVTISAYGPDWTLLQRWEGPANDFAANGPDRKELVVLTGGDRDEVTE